MQNLATTLTGMARHLDAGAKEAEAKRDAAVMEGTRIRNEATAMGRAEDARTRHLGERGRRSQALFR